VPSPKVATYDLKPEMSAQGITDTVVNAHEEERFRRDHHELRQRRYGGPLRKAGSRNQSPVEAVDAGLGTIFQTLKPRGRRVDYYRQITGNAETMIDPATGGPHTYHTPILFR